MVSLARPVCATPFVLSVYCTYPRLVCIYSHPCVYITYLCASAFPFPFFFFLSFLHSFGNNNAVGHFLDYCWMIPDDRNRADDEARTSSIKAASTVNERLPSNDYTIISILVPRRTVAAGVPLSPCECECASVGGSVAQFEFPLLYSNTLLLITHPCFVH